MSSRAYHLKRKYNLTLEDYEQILKAQDYKCGVCRRPVGAFKTRLCVDHDHHTLAIRGLLCINCNRYIIGRIRDPEIFQRAAEYLRGPFTGIFAPPKVKKRRKRKTRKKKR